MQYCQVQYHDQELAQFVCLAQNCQESRKLCCSLCKINLHSNCGIRCVQHNDLKQFFQTNQNIDYKDIFKAKLRNLFIPIEQQIEELFNNQQNQIQYLDQFRNLCQFYQEQQFYDSQDCFSISEYFKDKVSISLVGQNTQIVLKSNFDQLDQLIQAQSQNVIQIIENIFLQFQTLAQQDLFGQQIQLNPIQQEIQINQNNPVQIKKDFEIYSHIKLQFQLYRGVIQDSPKQKQILIFEPKLDQDRYWGFKINKLSNMIKDNFFNIFTEQGVLGFGVIEESEKLIQQDYWYEDVKGFLLFSTGKTNLNQQTQIISKENMNIIFDYHHNRKQLKITAFEDQVSITFNLRQNVVYYPCLVISRGDAVAFLQEFDVNLLRQA